ncbi:phage tail protein I [Clostridium botulinum]|uniref:phage tail protein I n=1 Tax=Clostridium sp. VAP41 TaxID=2949979 RepID=UPI0013F0B158|nr:phage tail protein I [Clostridium sp. VAP41]NFG24853.1 phage tail protein I [Clostridium botulinum]NFR14762.1 phage tail protein I [Clostridium botulinum]NFR44744.1 phage tail protein I [Clostridium botulinum]NFS51637.1 phage tail protein I [Clostridium botulinum]
MELSKIDLLSLQTSYLQKDIFVQALCKALNPYFQKLSDSVRLVYVYGRIDELNEDAIDSLAWQFHVDFYDYTLSLDQKRELVKKSVLLHKIKGTPQSVIDSASTVFGKTKLKEWFEYDGKPFFFSLDIDITERGASPEDLKKLDTLINAYKNTRSWIELINIFFTTKGELYIGAVGITGEDIVVYPWVPHDISNKADVIIPIAQSAGNENIVTYPKEEI